MHTKAVGARRKWTAFDWFNTVFLVLLSAVFLYPLLMTLGLSFSSPRALVGQNVILLPKGFTLQSYQTILSDPTILRYYWNTIVYASTGTLTSLLLTSLLAYPLTVAEFKGKKLINILLLITMFFGGGMIPFYILLTQLHMIDTFWVMVVPGALSVYNMIIARTFIQSSIPGELFEAASIDGCSDTRYFFEILLPLSKAIIAVLALFSAVGHWNSYFNAMMYLNTRSKMPLQIVLREILIMNQIDYSTVGDPELILKMGNLGDVLKYALIVVSTVPILCVYPFVQKYFVKGVMIGSIKG